MQLDFYGIGANLVGMLDRTITSFVRTDLKQKIVLISGPRQTGKTTLARNLSSSVDYLNYDAVSDRKRIVKQDWSRSVELVVFDELHKMKKWKGWLKGIFDTEGVTPQILVTGSARLDIAKRMGDSLAGRHFAFRLHPITLKELHQELPSSAPEKNFLTLLNHGGFPEPFFSSEPFFYERWRRSHLDLILRQDLLDTENVRQITQIELLIELLRGRVGSVVSYQSLAEDLQVDISTVKRWLIMLENLFVIFRLTPFSRNVARSLLKSSKFYFYDNGQVEGNEGAKFENLVANALLSHVHFEQDTKGRRVELCYLRNKDGDEIDFALVEKQKVTVMLEAKWSDATPSTAFLKLKPKDTHPQAVQLVAELDKEKDYPFGVSVRSAPQWLSVLSI